MEKDNDLSSGFNQRYNIRTRKVLRVLSENSRAKITEISEVLGVSRRTVALKMKRMEKELKLHYTIEFNEEKLGLNRPHLILVRFNQKPDYNKISEILKRSYIPQIAISVEGTYDMLIYANALSGMEYAHWDKNMQTLLAPYKTQWQTSEVVHRQLGFFPLRSELIEKTQIKEKYKKILYILNRNSRIRFKDMAKELKSNVNTVVYNFNKIMKLGYIKSFTLAMEMPEEISFMSFLSKYTPSQGYEEASAQARKIFTSDDPQPLISRYLITAPLIGSYDFFTLGAFDSFDVAYKNDVLCHKKLFKKFDVKMTYGELKKVLIGSLPIRSIDTKMSYKTIKWSAD